MAVADRLTAGPVIVVGSSMGGWIGLHLALRRPERVQALVGIAAAPDFTEWGFSAPQRAALAQPGGDPQHPSLAFWQSGQALKLLDGDIGIHCPVRLIHGELDRDVPLAIAMQLQRRLRSADVQLTIVKGGGHRLSQPHETDCLLRTVAALLEPAP
jgi:pimeloyl-ACP methyl ester carboxylesterase